MGKIEEIIDSISKGFLSSPYKELEPAKGRRCFDFKSPFLGEGQSLFIIVQERQSRDLDFELEWVYGQLTSDCSMELLKMNYSGICGPFYASLIIPGDPPGAILCLKHTFTVPVSSSPKEAVDIFTGDILGIIMLKKNWPEGVEVWEKK